MASIFKVRLNKSCKNTLNAAREKISKLGETLEKTYNQALDAAKETNLGVENFRLFISGAFETILFNLITL